MAHFGVIQLSVESFRLIFRDHQELMCTVDRCCYFQHQNRAIYKQSNEFKLQAKQFWEGNQSQTSQKSTAQYSNQTAPQGADPNLSESKFIFTLNPRLVSILQYDTQNKGRKFYEEYKQKIDRVIYDLKSYNSESYMTPREILLTLYLIKVAQDCGYHNRVQGFQLRGTMRLLNYIVVNGEERNSPEHLTANETIYGYWLTSRIRCNNHEYKWKCYLMLLNQWGVWKKQSSQRFSLKLPGQDQTPPPFTLAQISSLLETYYMEEAHMSSQYHIVQFLVNNLFFNRNYYLTRQHYRQDQHLFIQTFAYLAGIQQHWLNGKAYYEMQQVLCGMSQIIQAELFAKLTHDPSILKSFLDSRNVKLFLSNTQYQTFQSHKTRLGTQNIPKNQSIDSLKQTDIQGYFIFLTQITQNKLWLKNIAYDHLHKIHFILSEILDTYFGSRTQKQISQMNLKTVSIRVRSWIKSREFLMEELQDQIAKDEQNVANAGKIESSVNKVARQFQQLLEYTTKKLDKQIQLLAGEQTSEKKHKKNKTHLAAKERQSKKQELIILKYLQQEIIKPLSDFIFANGKLTIMNRISVNVQKIKIIERLESFLIHFFGEQSQKKSTIQKSQGGNKLTMQNPYFWMLKYMKTQSTPSFSKQFILAQFQLILSQISKNVSSKTPQPYSINSVYNIFAYLCKLQEKIVNIQQKQQINKNYLGQIQVNPISKKKQYQQFLLYKNYLSNIIFRKSVDKQSQRKSTIHKKYRIQQIFNNQSQSAKQQSDEYSSNKSLIKKKSDIFNIEVFFYITFKLNRYYNHKKLSEQVLLNLFGTVELLNNNTMEYIGNTNQRSGQNMYPLIYMMLLAEDKQIGKGVGQQLQNESIKSRIFQSINEKAKGSLVTNILREVISPRKTSFLKKAPLKYRQKPYSIFQAVSRQSPQRKSLIMSQFLKHFCPSKSHLFGWIQIIMLNVQVWGSHRSQLFSYEVMPWLASRINSGEVIRATIPYIVLCVFRLLRFALLRTNSSNQKFFIKFIQQFLPPLFYKLQSNKKEHAYSQLIGFMTEIQHLNKLSKFHPEQLNKVVLKCKQKLDLAQNSNQQTPQKTRYFDKLVQALDKTLKLTESSSSNNRNQNPLKFNIESRQAASKGSLFKKKRVYTASQKHQ